MPDTLNIIAADIGATNARFARFTADRKGAADSLAMHESVWLSSAQPDTFAVLLDNLQESELRLSPEKADITAIAVAGPVERGRRALVTNTGWDIDLSRPEEKAMGQVLLMNDFVAQAYACRSPVMRDAEKVLPGIPDMDAALAVMGPGTGFGACGLMPTASGFIAVPGEGGHAEFPFVTPDELEFQKFMRSETGRRHITPDIVVTGGGLQRIHKFLTGQDISAKEVASTFDQESRTLRWFARFYARTCRNIALTLLSMGGVYLTGGISAKNPAIVRHPVFGEEFHASETHGKLLEQMPVFLNRDEDAGLWGAAFHGLQVLSQQA